MDARSTTETRRQIATVEVTGNNDDAASAVTNPTALVSATGSATIGGNAGYQFGQRSRSLGMFRSSMRLPSTQNNHTISVSMIESEIHQGFHGYAELDSHADTCTIGASFKVIAYTEKSCSVTPFHPQYQSMQNSVRST
jgi:hypothetical protein